MGGSYNELAGATQQLGSDTEHTYKSLGKDTSSALQTAGDVYVKYLDHRDISRGAAEGAGIIDNLNKQWNETVKTADPNDPTTAAKFREEVLEPTLNKFKEGFTTENSQKWAENFSNQYRQHVYQQTSADMSTLAGIALKTNVEKTVNTLSSTVRQDPSSLDLALRTADSSIAAMAGSSPNLDGITAAKVRGEIGLHAKEAIVKSWFLGVAEKNPEAAVKALEDGKYSEFIKGDEAKTIINYARTNARLARSEARNDRVMADHTAKMEFNQKANELELSTIPGGPGDPPTLPKDYWSNIKQLGQMPGAQLDPGRLKSMVENGEKITARLGKPEPLGPVSHETTMDLLRRMRATDGSRIDTNDPIYEAYGAGRLNTADFKFLQSEFKDLRTPEGEKLGNRKEDFIKAVKPMIDKSNPLMGKIDPSGPEGVYRFTVDLNAKIDEYRKAGKNPYDLLDPSKPDYMGSPAALMQYQKPLQQSLQDTAAKLRASSAPAPVAAPSASNPPPSLRGIASLEWSPKRQQYRDTATGDIYNADGSKAGGGVQKFFSGAAEGGGDDDGHVSGAEHYKDFRNSDNIDDRRVNSGSIKERLREIFFGKDATYGALTPREFNNRMSQYSSDELVKIYRSGGPSKIAKELGFDDIGKKK